MAELLAVGTILAPHPPSFLLSLTIGVSTHESADKPTTNSRRNRRLAKGLDIVEIQNHLSSVTRSHRPLFELLACSSSVAIFPLNEPVFLTAS